MDRRCETPESIFGANILQDAEAKARLVGARN
jgi:hypothetical protein